MPKLWKSQNYPSSFIVFMLYQSDDERDSLENSPSLWAAHSISGEPYSSASRSLLFSLNLALHTFTHYFWSSLLRLNWTSLIPICQDSSSIPELLSPPSLSSGPSLWLCPMPGMLSLLHSDSWPAWFPPGPHWNAFVSRMASLQSVEVLEVPSVDYLVPLHTVCSSASLYLFAPCVLH